MPAVETINPRRDADPSDSGSAGAVAGLVPAAGIQVRLPSGSRVYLFREVRGYFYAWDCGYVSQAEFGVHVLPAGTANENRVSLRDDFLRRYGRVA